MGKLAAPAGLAGLLGGPRRPPQTIVEAPAPVVITPAVIEAPRNEKPLPDDWKQITCNPSKPLYQFEGYDIYTSPPGETGDRPPRPYGYVTARDKKWAILQEAFPVIDDDLLKTIKSTSILSDPTIIAIRSKGIDPQLVINKIAELGLGKKRELPRFIPQFKFNPTNKEWFKPSAAQYNLKALGLPVNRTLFDLIGQKITDDKVLETVVNAIIANPESKIKNRNALISKIKSSDSIYRDPAAQALINLRDRNQAAAKVKKETSNLEKQKARNEASKEAFRIEVERLRVLNKNQQKIELNKKPLAQKILYARELIQKPQQVKPQQVKPQETSNRNNESWEEETATPSGWVKYNTQFYNPTTQSRNETIPNSNWLVPNWELTGPDEEGDFWYYNPITEESQWELSSELLAQRPVTIKKMSVAPPRRGGKRKTQRRRKNKRSTRKYYKTR